MFDPKIIILLNAHCNHAFLASFFSRKDPEIQIPHLTSVKLADQLELRGTTVK